MDEKNLTTGQWLTQELIAIREKMSATLNARLNPELYSFDDERKEVTLKFPVQDWQVNGLGTLHGGITSTMMDLTMCMAIFCYTRETIPPTISMTINYLRPVPMDDGVLITARVTSAGKRNATAYCEAIVPATGKVASTAVGTYAIVPKKA